MPNPESSISRISLYKLHLPLREPFVISLETIEFADTLLVEIETADDKRGYGECSPYRTIAGETQAGAFTIGQELARLLIGEDARAIHRCLDQLDAHITGNRCLKSAFDMALYDLAAQRAGLPLYAYLGGENKKELRTDMTVSIGTPEKMAIDSERLVEKGFESIKVKLGRGYPDDVLRIRAIREAIGDQIPLRIDANQGWDVPTALRILRQLAKLGVEYCEAPIPSWQYHDLPFIRRQSPIPIMADESLFDHHDAHRLSRLHACDHFNIKLAKSGGIRNAGRIIAIAEGAGIYSQVGCFYETRLGLTALAHLALAHENIRYCDMDSALMLAEDPVEGGIQYGWGGVITLDDSPGLGAYIPKEYLKECEVFSVPG